jgi:hypothetical protein
MRTPQTRRHPTALRPEVVEQIRIEYYTTDVSLRELATRYRKTVGTIWQIGQ